MCRRLEVLFLLSEGTEWSHRESEFSFWQKKSHFACAASRPGKAKNCIGCALLLIDFPTYPSLERGVVLL